MPKLRNKIKQVSGSCLMLLRSWKWFIFNLCWNHWCSLPVISELWGILSHPYLSPLTSDSCIICFIRRWVSDVHPSTQGLNNLLDVSHSPPSGMNSSVEWCRIHVWVLWAQWPNCWLDRSQRQGTQFCEDYSSDVWGCLLWWTSVDYLTALTPPDFRISEIWTMAYLGKVKLRQKNHHHHQKEGRKGETNAWRAHWSSSLLTTQRKIPRSSTCVWLSKANNSW